MKMAEELLAAWLHEQAKAWQLPGQEAEVISKEFFRTIHGYYDSGEIISLRMQLKPGILQTVIGRRWHFEIEAWLDIFPAFDWMISPTHPERQERLLYTRDQLLEEGF